MPRPRRFAHAHILLVATLILAAPLGANAATEGERVQVQRVLDGDSLRLNDGREIRLIGINTPEFGRDGSPDQLFAEAARDRAAVLAQGRTVRLIYDAERFDRYGRTLAYVVLADGRDLQEILAREGLAWFVAIPPNVARLSQYRAAEAQARRAGRGVWAAPAYAPLPAERLSPDDTGFRRVMGTVRSVSDRGGTLTLRLSDGVDLALPAAHQGFSGPARSLVGKRVLARGWLTEYKNGLRMRITHPAMLELLQ